MEAIRNGSLRPLYGKLPIGQWNVEGLTKVKIFQLQQVMVNRGFGVLCMQETHCVRSEYYVNGDGYFVVLSGTDGQGRDFSGVGFLIAPWARSAIIGFKQISARVACLKMRVQGGKLVVVNGYAPHNGYPHDVRQAFFHEITQAFLTMSCYG